MDNLIKLVDELFKSSKTIREFNELLILNDANIKIVEDDLVNSTTLGAKRKLETELCIIKYYSCQIKEKIKQLERGKVIEPQQQNVVWNDIKSAFKTRIQSGIVINLHHTDPVLFMADCLSIIENKIENACQQFISVKVNVILCYLYIKNSANEIKTDYKYFCTSNYVVTVTSLFHEIYDKMVNNILLKMSEFQERDSGWALKEVISLAVNINKYSPLKGNGFIELPQKLKTSNAILNVKNNDKICFVWCILACLTKRYSVNTKDYPQNYHDFLNLFGIQFPLKLCDIAKFERQNPDISVNVFGIHKDGKTIVGPLYHTKEKKKTHANLLYLTKRRQSHYCLIIDLGKICSPQISKHKEQKFICDRCLCYFNSNEKLKLHLQDCLLFDSVKINLPKVDNNKLKFDNYRKQIQSPYVIYADFESFTTKIDNDDKANQTEYVSYTYKYQKHNPYSVAYQTICSLNAKLNHFEIYRGEQPVKWFVKKLKEEATTFVQHILNVNKPVQPLTPEQSLEYATATHCMLCSIIFDDNNPKTLDHCHVTGLYRFALCRNCNLNLKLDNIIPIFFHNLSGYDGHFIVKELSFEQGPISIIPITKENYISFTKTITVNDKLVKLRFLDSYRFLSTSLDKLAKSLESDDFIQLKKAFPNMSLDIITRKGVFPYDYVDSFEKLQDVHLPNRKEFYNTLYDTNISNDDYKHANLVWNRFNVKTLGEYSDIYLKIDVLLLTDIFENYRKICLRSYGLDPAKFYTTAGFSWQAMLKMTKIQLELLTDIDMILFIEKAIRGGLVQCSKRYAKANNKFLKSFDQKLNESYIMYFDVNNLYGWAMSNALPYGDFCWENDIEYVKNWIIIASNQQTEFNSNIQEEEEFGYILEVDLHYPKHLHEYHKDLPLLPYHFKSENSKDYKLMSTLYDREKLILHYKNLIQALSLGIELVHIHRVLKFKQSRWLKDYIDFNTNMRANAKTAFEKDLYKLKNNAVFGKTLENIRKHRDIRLVTHWSGRYGAESLIAQPNFKSVTIFDENLIAIELLKTEINFNKPIYVGMSILDLSKTLMYDYHYNYFKKKINKLELLYMDTDSLIYYNEIETPSHSHNVYEIISQDCNLHFDTSDYPSDNYFGITSANKKVIGKIKDEMLGTAISEFVGLKSKMYAIAIDSNKEIIKAKGVGESGMRDINFHTYKNSLFNNKKYYSKFKTIRSINHNLYSVEVNKKSLDSEDDKREVLIDKIHTLPWGYRGPR